MRQQTDLNVTATKEIMSALLARGSRDLRNSFFLCLLNWSIDCGSARRNLNHGGVPRTVEGEGLT